MSNHDKVLNEFKGSSPGEVKGLTTVVLMSLQEPCCPISHLLLIAEGARAGVLECSDDKTTPTMWRVSTLQSTGKSRCNSIWQQAKEEETIQNGHLAFKESVLLNYGGQRELSWKDLSKQIVIPATSSDDSRYRHGRIEITIAGIPESITFSVYDEAYNMLDSVSGPWSVVEVKVCIHYMLATFKPVFHRHIVSKHNAR